MMLFARPRDMFCCIWIAKCKNNNIQPFLRDLPMRMKRIMRMPITMMLVMTAIFETFVRSGSPLSKAVRALGRLWVDTSSAYQGNLTRVAAIKMGKNLSKLMLDPGLLELGLHISQGGRCSFSRSRPRLIVCFRALFKLMGNLSPSVPHLYWATLF